MSYSGKRVRNGNGVECIRQLSLRSRKVCAASIDVIRRTGIFFGKGIGESTEAFKPALVAAGVTCSTTLPYTHCGSIESALQGGGGASTRTADLTHTVF